jgi:hypothetical protein
MSEPCPMLGFIVVVELARARSSPPQSDFGDAWRDFLASRGLYAVSANSAGGRWAVASEASQALDADCEAVRAWLAVRNDVRRAEVGPIEDLNPQS